MIQDTLVLIKPDGVCRKMMGQIIAAIESLGVTIKHLQLITLTTKQAEQLYSEHKGKWHFPRNIKHITSGPVVIIHGSGDDALSKCRTMVENFRIANKDVIKLPRNLVHATAKIEDINKELEAVGCIK